MATGNDWTPSLGDRPGPKYLRIADALAEDIYSGRLSVGDRLPTHRDLAWRLGVTVGTVSRAYAESERRGLIVGEVGRGSFVRPGARSSATLAMPDIGGPKMIELGINRPPAYLSADVFSDALRELAGKNDLDRLMNYQAHTGNWAHRVAGATWISRRGLPVKAERVMLTSGVQHALSAAFMALADPGDTVLVENLTWSGTRALASLLRLTLKPLAMDDQGVLPDALEAAARATGAKLFYTMPTIHNPTTIVMGEERRRRIADICRRLGITVIEDDIYGYLLPDSPPPISAFLPEQSIYLIGAAKTMAPALRVGFAAMPEDRIGRFSASARAGNWMAPPLMAEIAAQWIENGTADMLARRMRDEARERHKLARRILYPFTYKAVESGFHIWLELPDPWRTQDLVEAARPRGLNLTPTDLFVPGRAETPHAIRLTLTATRDLNQLSHGLSLLVGLLQQAPEPLMAIA